MVTFDLKHLISSPLSQGGPLSNVRGKSLKTLLKYSYCWRKRKVYSAAKSFNQTSIVVTAWLHTFQGYVYRNTNVMFTQRGNSFQKAQTVSVQKNSIKRCKSQSVCSRKTFNSKLTKLAILLKLRICGGTKSKQSATVWVWIRWNKHFC